MVGKKTEELEIGRYLVPDGSDSLQNPRNHCVPFLDAFRDPVIESIRYIVMPLLRPFDTPAFGAIGEVADFVTQLLEVSHANILPQRDDYSSIGHRIHA